MAVVTTEKVVRLAALSQKIFCLSIQYDQQLRQEFSGSSGYDYSNSIYANSVTDKLLRANLIFNPAETSCLLFRQMWPSEVLNAHNFLRSEPAIAALPSRVREQAPSILFGQNEFPPKGAIIGVIASKSGQHSRIAITLFTKKIR
jgi:hypothetical protein